MFHSIVLQLVHTPKYSSSTKLRNCRHYSRVGKHYTPHRLSSNRLDIQKGILAYIATSHYHTESIQRRWNSLGMEIRR